MGVGGLIGLAALADTPAAQSRYPVQREETISRTLRFSGAGDRLLEVSTINGAIRVVGHDDEAIDVVVRKRVRAETDADANVAETTVGLEIIEAADAVRLRGHAALQPGCDADTVTWSRRQPRYQVTFDFDLRVPRTTRLRLCTVNNGEVHVDGMAADFDVDNVNGAIILTALRGSGRGVTVNGAVTASFAENPKRASMFKTVNGDVDVTFQPDLAADLLMRTFNGGLYTDFDVTPLPLPAAAPERRNGQFVYRANRYTAFRVGRGGPELTLDAFNGDVRILRNR